MYEIAVCDDMPEIAEKIKRYIDIFAKEHNIQNQVDIFYASDELYETLKSKKYDLLFLDLVLGEIDGIDIIKKLRQEKMNIEIAIVSFYDKYVFEGYSLNIFRYIMKGDRLQAGIDECLIAFFKKYEMINKKKILSLRRVQSLSV